MDKIDPLINDIKCVINEISITALQAHQSNTIIDLELLQNREIATNGLLRIKQFLSEANRVLDGKIARAKVLRAADVKKLDQAMSDFKNKSSWKNKLITNLQPQHVPPPNVVQNTTPVMQHFAPPAISPAIPPGINMPQHIPQQMYPTIHPEKYAPGLEIKKPIVSVVNGVVNGVVNDATNNATNDVVNGVTNNATNGVVNTITLPNIPMMNNVALNAAIPQARAANTTQMYFTTDIFLDAINVSSVKLVNEGGKLYFIPEMGHFAIKINDTVFHGNIGKIYNNQKDPVKVKACKFQANCNKPDSCMYYHDPLKYPGRKDIRNFAANSWMYIEPTANQRDPHRIRRFGSRDNIAIDIIHITKEEIDRFNDQVFHDILCMLVLKKYADVG